MFLFMRRLYVPVLSTFRVIWYPVSVMVGFVCDFLLGWELAKSDIKELHRSSLSSPQPCKCEYPPPLRMISYYCRLPAQLQMTYLFTWPMSKSFKFIGIILLVAPTLLAVVVEVLSA